MNTISLSWENYCKNWVSWEVDLLYKGYIITEQDMINLKKLATEENIKDCVKYIDEKLSRHLLCKN